MKMNHLSSFLQLLKEPLKILSQNGKLMAITATVYLVISFVSYLLFTFSSNPFVTDLIFKIFAILSAQPGTPEYTKLVVAIREDIGIFFGIEVAYIVLYFFVAVFAQTTVIIIASCYYTRNNLCLKELISKVSKTWTRPFVTSFYVHLLASGYLCSLFLPFLVPTLVLYDHRVVLFTVLIFLAIIFVTFYLYLSVVWSLGIVISVVEETYGLSALGKAREMVKGKRVIGFVLNVFILLVLMVIFMVGFKLSPAVSIVAGVIQFICIVVVSMFQFMAYCGFYFQCKNDQMTKSRGLDYSQIPSAQVDEDLP